MDFSAVANLLSSDPAFSAEVLALANSPLYATACPTTSLTRAIVVLGLERTRSLTLTVAMQAFVGNVQMTPELQNSWRHSLACALVAEELAPALRHLRATMAIPPGLMHDLGRLGLLKAYPRPYAELLARSLRQRGQMLDAERRLFQVDHCQAGLMADALLGFSRRVSDDHRAPSLLPHRAGAGCGGTGRRGLPAGRHARISVGELPPAGRIRGDCCAPCPVRRGWIWKNCREELRSGCNP